MSDESLNQAVTHKLVDLEIRLTRLEVGTEERHKAYTDKHDALMDQMTAVQEDIKWFGKLSMTGFSTLFLAIVGALITLAFKKGIP